MQEETEDIEEEQEVEGYRKSFKKEAVTGKGPLDLGPEGNTAPTEKSDNDEEEALLN